MNRAAVDFGNSRIKVARFDSEGQILEHKIFQKEEEVESWLTEKKIDSLIVATVRKESKINYPQGKIHYLNTSSKLPFVNQYGSPDTLGQDRIAVISAAASIFPDENTLIFDTGTCMTIDFLASTGIYKGGNISPGPFMRAQAMHQFTSVLPLADLELSTPDMGTNTAEALSAGIKTGIKNEILGYINSHSSANTNLTIILCGGYIHNFEFPHNLKIFARPNFVLEGLYHLLLLNEN